jgi:hypothetical protein
LSLDGLSDIKDSITNLRALANFAVRTNTLRPD